MKPHGSILEFTRERNIDLMRAYRHQIRSARHIRMREIGSAIVNMPAARFWVSEERATIVVSAMLSGRNLPENMRPTKHEMFSEIFNRVITLRRSRPKASVFELVSEVVNSPAPKFYMLPRSAMDIIYKIKKGYYNEFFENKPYCCRGNIGREQTP